MSSRVLVFPSKRITFHIIFSLLILGNEFSFSHSVMRRNKLLGKWALSFWRLK
ncbi:hypothetical protein ACS0TY_033789 [Phlomoides rotata]